MGKLLPSRLRRFRVTAVTIAVLAIAFTAYFYIFVEDNRSNLHERAFRVLNQDASNLQEKSRTTITTARVEISMRMTMEKMDSGYAELYINPRLNSCRLPKARDREGKFNQQLEFTCFHDWEDKAVPPAPTSYIRQRAGVWRICYRDTVHLVAMDADRMYVKGRKWMEFNVQLKEFAETALVGRGDLFNDYLILKGDTIVFETFPSGLRVRHQDSLFARGTSVHAGNVLEIELSGEAYKVFAQQISIGNAQGLVLCGLMKEKRYRAEVYTVSVLTIVLVLVLLLLLALGYPFFKLALMSQGERLRVGDAFFCVFSLVVGTFVITLIGLSSYWYWFPDWSRRDENLRRLSVAIEAALRDELKSIYQQLDTYRELATPALLNSEAGYQTNLLQLPDTTRFYPRSYPYFEDVFWVDAGGNTRQEWTVGSVSSPTVNVKDRPYFRQIREERHWDIGAGGDSMRLMLQPIFNRIKGNNLTVISVPYTRQAGRPVMALETSLHSVIDPVLPLGYGFCVLNESGEVWFHSDQKKNLQEKFLRECGEDKALRAAMNGNAARHLNMTYDGSHFRGYVSPLGEMPLYVVVFEKNDYYKTASSMIMSTAALCYVLFLLPLTCLLLIQKLTYPRDFRLSGEGFAFSWLSPRQAHRDRYRQLLWPLACWVVLELLLMLLPVSPSGLIAYYALGACAAFSAARLVLCRPRERVVEAAYWGAFTVFALLASSYFYRMSGLAPWPATGWLAGIFLPLTMLLPVRFGIDRGGVGAAVLGWLSLRQRYLLLCFLAVWLLALLPGLAFYRMAYEEEQRITTAHTMLTMARDMTARKQRIENKYREVAGKEKVLPQLIQQRGRYDKVIKGLRVSFVHSERTSASRQVHAGAVSTDSLLHTMRRMYNAIAAENNDLLFGLSHLKDRDWRQGEGDALQLHYHAYERARPDSIYLAISGTPGHFRLPLPVGAHPDDHWALVFWLPLLTLLAALYALINYAIKHLFNLGLFDPEYALPVGAEQLTRVFFEDRQPLFLTGAYLPERNNFLDRLLQAQEPMARVQSLRQTPDPAETPAVPAMAAVDDGNHLMQSVRLLRGEGNGRPVNGENRGKEPGLVITHFEEILYCLPDDDVRVQALQEQVREARRRGEPVLIVSTQTLAALRDACEQCADSWPEEKQRMLMRTWHQWECTLGDFQEAFFHLNVKTEGENKGTSGETNPDNPGAKPVGASV